jgi:UDP-N-acetylglucosamine 2-epimerase (non-hydrolysing)
VVVGDVNATCACAITAKKELVRLAHIEAGLRSFDLAMPEEINRVITDRLSDLLFTTDRIASQNLRREGVGAAGIAMVGNTMIDSLLAHRDRAAALRLDDVVRENLLQGAGAGAGRRVGVPEMVPNAYAVLTLHRPANVDAPEVLAGLVRVLVEHVAPVLPVVWPVHPRTWQRLQVFGLWNELCSCPGVVTLRPVGYHEMLKLNMHARVMLTDSGGLQEECCVLGTPCVTLRHNTERPLTLTENGGVCELAGNDAASVRASFEHMRSRPRRPFVPPLWDGHAAERIVAVLTSRG